MLHPTPFAIAWSLVAVYGAVLLAAAVRIGLRLVRARGPDENRAD